jgi:hypothetical protein
VNLMHRVGVATRSSCRVTIHALRRFHTSETIGFGGFYVGGGSMRASRK